MLNLIPYPSGSVRENAGSFSLPALLGAELGSFAPWCLDAFCCRLGLTPGGANWLELKKDPALAPEAYRLEVKQDGIRLEASAEAGIVWALTTVAELARDGKVPCCAISDGPGYSHRGLSLDCVRHFFPAEEVKRIIEEISLSKMNVLHWHLTDDQGWRIESKKFPALHKTSGDYFTWEQIRDIVEFARVRGVEVVPEVDMPGHTTALLAAYPQFSCSEKTVNLANAGGIYPVILCPGKEQTMAFVEEVLEEILPLFPGPRFHLGGDEAPKQEWKKCPHCQKKMQALGLTEAEDLQGWFTVQAARFLQKHGKTPVCWNETLLASNAPDNIQIQYWTLQHRKSMERYAGSGGTWIYSDMFEYYFDYPYAMSSLKKVYNTVPRLGKKPAAEAGNLLGLEACLWAERISDTDRLENMIFPRAHALAEVSWCGRRSYREFIARLEAFISGPNHAAIRYMPRFWWEPRGKKRREEAIGCFMAMNDLPEEVRTQTLEAAAPSKEYAASFVKKFYRVWDIPFLLKALLGSGIKR